MSKKELVLSPIKKDVLGSFIIGTIASFFAFIILVNLSVPTVYLYFSIIFLPMCVIGVLVGRFLSRFIQIMYKFVKFGEVGGLNWLMDLGVLNVLILLTGLSTGIYYSIYKGVSFLASATNSYFWNKFWVFEKDKTKEVGKEVGKFAVSTLTGLVFNVALASAVIFFGKNLLSGYEDKVIANIAAIAGSLSAMVLNFVLYRFWVFK